MTIGVTYTALIIGELAPKHIALNNPEPIAIRVARPLAFVARAAAPVIWLLNASTQLLLRLLYLQPRFERAVTEEDIHYLVAEGARLGVIHTVERDMIEGVLDLADSPVRTIMTPAAARAMAGPQQLPRSKSSTECVPARTPSSWSVAVRSMRSSASCASRICSIRSWMAGSPDVEQVTRAPLIVHESTAILRTLDLFRKTPVHTAVVVDEFGSLQGIVTRTDLLETVAGDLPKIDAPARPKVTQREDGSYLIDAAVPFSDVMQLIGMGEAPAGDYVTLAGFILSQLRELPKPGDHLESSGWRFEVVDMDGRRIDMVLVQRQPEH